MDIKTLLSYLHVSHGPNSSGEYMCRCPAHADGTASLCVRQGDKGILLHCQAGCSTQDVVAALGLKMSDLFDDDGKGRPASRPRSPAPAPAKPAAKGGPKPLGQMVKAYVYTDEGGKPLFEVCRFESVVDGKRSKTFRQRHLDPGNPKAKAGGYVWNLEGVRSVIYRLPEVIKAIGEGRTVYLVEGEKDADALAELGQCATTNPGGASKSGASKWLTEHTELLKGAHVVILPDNDAAGLNDRQQVAQKLLSVAATVKLLDLRQACPSLPTKGDITDMLGIMGREAGMKALQQLEAATAPLDASAALATAARDAAAALINNLPGYCVDNGCICQWAEDAPKRLCTFTALTTGVVTRDDGVSEEKCYLVDGWNASGAALPRVRVKAKDFRSLSWIDENWDIRANILPGTACMDKVRYVLSEAGVEQARRTVEYTHTGWRRIGGRWCYLYSGGAIGAEGVQVDLGDALANYQMDAGYNDISEADDLTDVMLLPTAIPRRIGVPLVALAFLAPLRDALMRAGYPPAFSVYLVGGTGARKSTISALILSYFGRFTALTLPASFNDTSNYVGEKAFALKDMVLAVDDYHPEGNLQARRKMEDMAQRLSRAFGDLAQRGRMNADRTLAGSKPPRSLALISGEDMPNVRDSGLARYYTIDIRKDDIPVDETLTHLQDLAADGALARLMRRYIEWLAPQMDRLPAALAGRYKQLRSEVQGMKFAHSRTPGTVAHLLIGYEMYMKFLTETGLLPDADGSLMQTEMNEAIRDIVGNARKQSADSREQRPGRMFLDTIGELLTSKACSVADLTAADSKGTVTRGHIGYMDALYYYLLPESSYVAVCELYTKKGEAFPLSRRALYKQMAEDGQIAGNAADGKSTKVKNIGGKSMRLLWVPRAGIDGARGDEQMKMSEIGGDGFVESNEPTPFDS